MTEINASERYLTFQRLRSRFNGGNEYDKDAITSLHQEPKKEKSETQNFFDNHGEGFVPHFISLVDEGDILQQSLSPGESCSTSKTLVKGHWRNCDLIKSNHLNSPDFESFDSVSVTSCSSAYSSKTDSSLLSPSPVELSDTGSCDTHNEYDIKSCKVQIGTEKCWDNIDVSSNDEVTVPVLPTNNRSEANIPRNFVKHRTKVWNDLIGDWTFNGSPTPMLVYKYRVTNEIKVPIPIVTQENLLGSASGNSSPDEVSPSGSSEIHLSLMPPGKIVWKIKCSTSNLISFFEPLSCTEDKRSKSRSDSGIDSPVDAKTATFKEKGVSDGITITVTATREERKEGTDNSSAKQNKIIRKEEGVGEEITEAKKKMFTTNGAKEEDQETANRKAAFSGNTVSDGAIYDKSRNTITTCSSPLPTHPKRPRRWKEAHKLYKAIQAMMEPQHSQCSNAMSVKQRTQLFGGSKTNIV